jgi:hypothetical protein
MGNLIFFLIFWEENVQQNHFVIAINIILVDIFFEKNWKLFSGVLVNLRVRISESVWKLEIKTNKFFGTLKKPKRNCLQNVGVMCAI